MRLVHIDDFLGPKTCFSWINPEKKYIYVKIPKAGGTTMLDILGLPISERFFHPPNTEDFFTFTVIRNPFERFFSGFNELCKREHTVTQKASFYEQKTRDDKVRALIEELYLNQWRNPYYFDTHIRPQWWFLTYDNGQMYEFDKIYCLEDMDEALIDLRAKGFVLPGKALPQLNKSNEEPISLSNHYLGLLAEIYRKDIELYNSVFTQKKSSAPETCSGLSIDTDQPYFSQHGEDAILDRIFSGKRNGFFVEIGCIDGKRFSNTLHFAQKGWTGLCVEAHPDYIEMLKENRPDSIVVHAAVTDRNQTTIPFYANSRGSLSTLDKDNESEFRQKFGSYFTGFEKVEVAAMTLKAILERHGKGQAIDFISLDIEGHEVEALAGHDFSACKPRVWVIECDTTEHRRKIEHYLLPQGYYFLGILGGNAFFSLDPADIDKIPEQIPALLTHTEHPCDSNGDQQMETMVKLRERRPCHSG